MFEGTRNLYWRLTPRENLRYFAGIRGLGGKRLERDIDRLLDKFNLTDKKIVLTECITEESKSLLRGLGYDFYFTNNGSKIEIDILDFQELYKIIEVLKNINILIKEIKQKDINFERVYLNLTDGKVG